MASLLLLWMVGRVSSVFKLINRLLEMMEVWVLLIAGYRKAEWNAVLND